MSNPLGLFDWEQVAAINRQLCDSARYQHGTTSEGYEPAKALFHERKELPDLGLPGTIQTLFELHRMAPFLFLNGNTFTLIGRQMLFFTMDGVTPLLTSIVGHHIAGTEVRTLAELEEIFRTHGG